MSKREWSRDEKIAVLKSLCFIIGADRKIEKMSKFCFLDTSINTVWKLYRQ